MIRPAATRSRRRTLVTPWTMAAALTIVGGAVALAVGISGSSVGPSDDVTIPGQIETTPTGEQNTMGMPVIETPGLAGGRSRAGAVEVTGATWELGTVPLNTAVRPTWILRNTGTEAVTIGEPHPEVREGCCPGPFTIGAARIPAGGETTLTFELSMHPGMDGWHDIAVHVPVRSGATEDVLTLGVTGDFRDL